MDESGGAHGYLLLRDATQPPAAEKSMANLLACD
jgi:hypothetical protein